MTEVPGVLTLNNNGLLLSIYNIKSLKFDVRF